jgi:hypothetical protein
MNGNHAKDGALLVEALNWKGSGCENRGIYFGAEKNNSYTRLQWIFQCYQPPFKRIIPDFVFS